MKEIGIIMSGNHPQLVRDKIKTVIVGPIRIFESAKEEGQKAFDLVIGCNYFRGCENKQCAYSWVSRLERKNIVRQVPT